MELPKRKPNRLKNYSYSSPGAYFITICTNNKEKLLGDIIVGFGACDEPKNILSRYGVIAEKYIHLMNEKYEYVSIDKFIIMPNHIHMIIVIEEEAVNGSLQAPNPTNDILPKFISLFKRYCNLEFKRNIWQKSYHDHIIRNDKEYEDICNYIEYNVYKWLDDRYYSK